VSVRVRAVVSLFSETYKIRQMTDGSKRGFERYISPAPN
jgi:hypothetical protein